MKELIGKTISSLSVNADQSILAFHHPDGTSTVYAAYSECCSETWFADITGVNALLGATVTEVEDVSMDVVEDGRTRQKCDEFYGVKITTDKGRADIIYRNSSNGYYGGSIYIVPSPAPDRLNDRLGSAMTSIADDWSA